LGVVTDITARVQIEQALKESEQLNRAILAAIPDKLFRIHSSGRILGFPSRYGDPHLPVEDPRLSSVQIPQLESLAAEALKTREIQIHEFQVTDVEGEQQFFEARYIPYTEDEVLVILRNITERIDFEQKLQYMANHDPLTHLPNRILFRDRLDHALELADRHADLVAVLLLDLDGFKMVNDTLGHDSGDLVLIEVAGRLGNCIRESDTLARLGGDEFVFILEKLDQPEDAALVAEKILVQFHAPFVVTDHQFSLSASIGISIKDPTKAGISSETMLKHADIAMYRVKNQDKNGYTFYDSPDEPGSVRE
jgi:diguanylate cyclase (GGDEF)-like protein